MFKLEVITTKDRVELYGLISKPKRKGKKAVIFVHGLTGNVMHSPKRTTAIAKACRKNNIAFGFFNNRGHDYITSFKKGIKGSKKKKYLIRGAGMERFKDCVGDIGGMVNYFSREGYKQIYLVGHSTGANKVLYYMYKAKDRRVKGLALLGALSDIPEQKEILGEAYNKVLKRVKLFRKRGKNAFLPKDIVTWPMNAQRYLSLYTPGSAEDVFQYHNPKAKWKALGSIKKPILVAMAEKDQYLLNRKAIELVRIFSEKAVGTKEFTAKVIRDTDHGFKGKEGQLASIIIRWIKSI